MLSFVSSIAQRGGPHASSVELAIDEALGACGCSPRRIGIRFARLGGNDALQGRSERREPSAAEPDQRYRNRRCDIRFHDEKVVMERQLFRSDWSAHRRSHPWSGGSGSQCAPRLLDFRQRQPMQSRRVSVEQRYQDSPLDQSVPGLGDFDRRSSRRSHGRILLRQYPYRLPSAGRNTRPARQVSMTGSL